MSPEKKTKSGEIIPISGEFAVLCDTINRLTFVLRDEIRVLHTCMTQLSMTVVALNESTDSSWNAAIHALQAIRDNLPKG